MTRFSTMSRLILSLMIALWACLPASALSSTHFAGSSRLASGGKWVKIRCDKPGMQQIDYSTLIEWGFLYPSRVRVFGFSCTPLATNQFMETMPDDLPEVPIIRYPDTRPTKIIFYNDGVVAHNLSTTDASVKSTDNKYSNSAYYIIGEIDHGYDTKPGRASFNNTAGNTYPFHRTLEYRQKKEFNPSKTGSFYFGDKCPFADRPSTHMQLIRPYLGTGSAFMKDKAKGRFFYRMAGGMKTDVSHLMINLTTPDNGHYIDIDIASTVHALNTNTSLLTYRRTNEGMHTFDIRSGITNIDITFHTTLLSGSDTPKWIAREYYGWTYLKENVLPADSAQMTMYFDFANPGNHNFLIAGKYTSLDDASVTLTAPAPVVWDITYPDQPLNVDLRASGTGYAGSIVKRTPPHGSLYTNTTKLVAFRPEMTLARPEFAGRIAPQNLHALQAADMIIITNNKLRSHAERLAQIHRSRQGMEVLVATHDEILNEFSSGTPHAMAYRLFAKMIYDRGMQPDGTSRLKYMLLFGPSTYDILRVEVPDDEYLLTYPTEDDKYAAIPTFSYTTNDYFGILNDGYIHSSFLTADSQVAVGLIDARNSVEADNTIDKIERYLDNPPVDDDIYNRALLLADDGDHQSYLNDQEVNSQNLKSANPPVTHLKLYNALYPWDDSNDATYLRAALETELKKGCYLWSYSGHANNLEFRSGEMLWNISLANSVSIPNPPIAMLATCHVYPFDQPEENLGHYMLTNPDGGVIAAVASGRSVLSTFNKKINHAFSRSLYEATPGMTIGDVYRIAKDRVRDANASATGILANTLCYNLAGDPAIPVIAPARSVAATSIAGSDITPGDQTMARAKVWPGVPFTLSGKILGADGATDTSFDGKVLISIFDGGKPVDDPLQDGSSLKAVVQVDETLLSKSAAEVRAGEFSARITLPEGTVNDTVNRVTFFAINTDRSIVATGLCNNLQLQPVDPDKTVTDVTPPVISALYIDSPEFTDGDMTGSDITVYATLSDDGSGIDTSAGMIGGEPVLTLDSSRSCPDTKSFMSPGTDGSVRLAYPLGDLADGRHTLRLSVSDRAGNSATRSVSFNVQSAGLAATLSVEENPAREQATLTLTDATFSDTSTQTTVVIRDADGNTVFSASGITMPYVWDLNDSSGNPVEDGLYTASLLFDGGRVFGHTPSTSFIVVR